MSIGPAKCGDPRVTNPAPIQEKRAEREAEAAESLAVHSSLDCCIAAATMKKVNLNKDTCSLATGAPTK